MGMVPPRLALPRRREQLKEEHPSSYPDMPFEVSDDRPMCYFGNGEIGYPPQGGSGLLDPFALDHRLIGEE